MELRKRPNCQLRKGRPCSMKLFTARQGCLSATALVRPEAENCSKDCQDLDELHTNLVPGTAEPDTHVTARSLFHKPSGSLADVGLEVNCRFEATRLNRLRFVTTCSCVFACRGEVSPKLRNQGCRHGFPEHDTGCLTGPTLDVQTSSPLQPQTIQRERPSTS